VGQLVATPLAAELFSSFHGHGLLLACLLAIAVLWCVCSWIGSVWLLYLWFLATGLLTATLDTGIQLLTRRHYRHRAGPWLTTSMYTCLESL
jgi:type IV secretory pathway TrbD component